MILSKLVPPKIVMENVLHNLTKGITILKGLKDLFQVLKKISIRSLQGFIRSPIENLTLLSLKPLSIIRKLLVINVERKNILQNIVE